MLLVSINSQYIPKCTCWSYYWRLCLCGQEQHLCQLGAWIQASTCTRNHAWGSHLARAATICKNVILLSSTHIPSSVNNALSNDNPGILDSIQTDATVWVYSHIWYQLSSHWRGQPCCSECISHKISNFNGPILNCNRAIKGFGGQRIMKVNMGKWEDNDSSIHEFWTPNSYYVPDCKVHSTGCKYRTSARNRREDFQFDHSSGSKRATRKSCL